MPDKGQESDGPVSRRKFVQAAVAAGIAGVAGCGGDGGGTATDTATDTATEAGTATDTPGGDVTATPTQGGTPTEETPTATPTPEGPQTPEGEPNTKEIASYIAVNLQDANHNYYSTKGQQAFGVFTEEFFRPENVSTGEVITSGYTLDTPWIPYKDQIEITTWVENVRLDPPFDRYYTFDDRITYWDGTPMTAEVLRKQAKIYWYRDSSWNKQSVTFNAEVTGKYKYHEWRDKGNAPGQEPNPTNRVIMESNTPQYRIPIHPDFTNKWYQKLEDAASAGKTGRVDEILTNLDNTFITLQEFAENQWGSGVWRMPKNSEDVFDAKTVTANRLLFERWDEHPNSENTLLDTLRVYLANLDRQKILAQQSKVDIGRGIVTPTGGRVNRQILPKHMGQISKALAQGSDKVEFNLHNKHLARLWVRRAIVTAVDWSRVSDNGWNLESVNNIQPQVGLIPTLARQTFSSEFLEKMHRWPIKSDFNKAAEYMRRAGYTKSNGKWVGPDGDTANLEAITPAFLSSYYTPGMNTIGTQLQEFGFKFSNSQLQGPQYVPRLQGENGLDYDLVIQWAPFGPVPNWYWSSGGWANNPTLSGDPDTPGLPTSVDADDPPGEKDSADQKDLQNVPLQVQLPTEIGSIEAPDQAGRNPDLQAAGIDSETIDLAELVHSFRRPDIKQDQFTANARKVARFHNYFLPDYYFHQLQFGTWGDLRDYDWAPYPHPINWYQHPNQKDFQTSAGIAQPSWDDEYAEPGTRPNAEEGTGDPGL